MKNILRYRRIRIRHLIAALSLGLLLAVALVGCTSSRAGVAHSYDSPLGHGTVYIEGSSYGPHQHRVPPGHQKPKKAKKPKKHKEKKPKPPKAPKKHKHDKHRH